MARVLVVDNDRPTLDAMAKLLRQDGHEVHPFTNGADALDALSRESFDAVVLDVDLPHQRGEMMVSAARQRSPAACLVAVTSKVGTHFDWLDAGVCAVVEKPIDYDGVATALAECQARGGRREGCRIQLQVERPHLTQLRLR